MHHRVRGFGLAALAIAALVCSVSACASSGNRGAGSGDATKLLQQTFSGSHALRSGNLSFAATIDPTGSSTVTQPVVLRIAGPFQSLGKGKLPKADLTASISALGEHATLAILSTGTRGYVILDSTSYRLPAASFRQLESSFSQRGAGSGGPASLGIDPLRWLVDPSVVGTADVGGVQTTHIHAGVNVAVLLDDITTLLRKESSLVAGSAGVLPSGIPAGTRSQLERTIRTPSVDVWTGNGDKTLRRLAIDVTVPVGGQASALLGGLRSAGIAIDLQYADVNQPQSIEAPASAQSYSAFETRIDPLIQAFEGALAGGLIGGATTGGIVIPSPSLPAPASSARMQSYTRCVTAAGSDVAKVQRCTSLLAAK